MIDVDRVSQTLMTPVRAEEEGFNVRMPGLDLATLIQMACAQRQRLIVRVQSHGHEGLLFFAQGQLVHATADGFAGETAVRRMLVWQGGDFQVCERAWPSQPSINASIEALLLRAAQSQDEDVKRRSEAPVRALPTRNSQAQSSREATGPRAVPMRREPPQLPPPPPLPNTMANSMQATAPSERPESAVVASVRISEDGQVIPGHGDADTLSQLVAYTMRLGTLAGAHLGLGPMDALYADLGDRRVVVFNDQGDTVGLVLTPGTTVTELRRQLGV